MVAKVSVACPSQVGRVGEGKGWEWRHLETHGEFLFPWSSGSVSISVQQSSEYANQEQGWRATLHLSTLSSSPAHQCWPGKRLTFMTNEKGELCTPKLDTIQFEPRKQRRMTLREFGGDRRISAPSLEFIDYSDSVSDFFWEDLQSSFQIEESDSDIRMPEDFSSSFLIEYHGNPQDNISTQNEEDLEVLNIAALRWGGGHRRISAPSLEFIDYSDSVSDFFWEDLQSSFQIEESDSDIRMPEDFSSSFLIEYHSNPQDNNSTQNEEDLEVLNIAAQRWGGERMSFMTNEKGEVYTPKLDMIRFELRQAPPHPVCRRRIRAPTFEFDDNSTVF